MLNARSLFGLALFAVALLLATWSASHPDGRMLLALIAFVWGTVEWGVFSENVATFDKHDAERRDH